jgi:hypothetical protein
MQRRSSFALLLLVCLTLDGPTNVFAHSGLTQLAQAQPAPAQPAPAQAAPDPAAPAADAQAPVEEPIGNVATVTGSASVVRNNETTPLKVKDDIYLNDVVQTGANSALGATFNDATTFSLKAKTQIAIDTYVFEDGGKNNAGVFDVAKGTAAFVAAAVAKTGDMKITTPTATLGIRGTTGLVEVPVGAAANNPNNVAIKLYPDADGRVGRIEVNDRAGARLGFLTQGASGFTIRPGAGGARFAAVPLAISPQMMARDQGFVRQETRHRISDDRSCSSNANSAAPIRVSLPTTRRAADRSKTDCRGKTAPDSNRACKIVPVSRSPVSKTVPDNNCRTGRGKRCNRLPWDGPVRPCSQVRRRQPVARNACNNRAARNVCNSPAARNPFRNRASGKACDPAVCQAYCGKACRSGPGCACRPRAASRHRRKCGRAHWHQATRRNQSHIFCTKLR